ncbi:hypothetical protein EW026_g5508 [Hermanssonia centrifuga]|uniref:BHLH domain-containing protein n=1 Tax=Hermanssonia centrifuga TaxID=98765 RepID=A0A4S4KEY6_9APHY|nr:hypothetical protein EW026_g5508 [Hermanssonia centrifuga]
MTISAASPASPAPQSPSADGPATPVSPANSVQTLALPPPVDGTPAPASTIPPAPVPPAAKRKPSRRANTAERRATHNAVERARRETLNGRFLDLAALLPNLSQIRRPSKSSIVNSSIAHIHASRRHRHMAARELRLIKLEADALRRELNEWRDRSGLPRVEEPVRGEGFQMIMSGEVEILSAGPIEEEDGDEYGDGGYGDDDYNGNVPVVSSMGDDNEDMRHGNPMSHAAAASLLKAEAAGPFAHTAPNHGLHLQTILPRPANGAPSPMIVQSPTSVSFENPAMASMYEPPHAQQQFMMGGNVFSRMDESKWQMYGQQQQQFTPPASSHGIMPTQQQQYMHLNFQRQQAMMQSSGHHGHIYGSPIDNDDASSVGSAAGHSPVPGGAMNAGNGTKRERSGSMGSVGSAGSGHGNYEMSNVMASGAGVPRRMGTGAWDEGMGMGGGMGQMGQMGPMGGMGMAGRGAPTAISVGGGGNAQGFAAMML